MNERDRERLADADPYGSDFDYYAGYYLREDATFWVPHQQRGEFVEFDRLVNTIDDIIVGCGYREEDREWLTDLHQRDTVEFLRLYRGPAIGRVPMLENE